MTLIAPAFQSFKFDGSQRNHVDALVDDFRREHEQLIQNIQTEGDIQKQKQKLLHSKEMLRIQKHIKQMTVDEFNIFHNCDLLQMIRMDEVTTTSVLPAGMQTPSFKSKMMTSETPSRTIRRGEVIYSSNGSPLEKEEENNILLTVSKKKRLAASGEEESEDLNLVVGGVPTSLTAETIQQMPYNVQNEAFTNLKKMHENIGKLLQQFEQKTD